MAERRMFRVSTGSAAEAVMVRAAGNTDETVDKFTVPSGKTLRITDHALATQQTGSSVFRIRHNTLVGEEITRYVLNGVQSFQVDFKVPFRIDGGDTGYDFVLTQEQPGTTSAQEVAWTITGQQD